MAVLDLFKLGENEIPTMCVGTDNVVHIYCGDTLVWEPGEDTSIPVVNLLSNIEGGPCRKIAFDIDKPTAVDKLTLYFPILDGYEFDATYNVALAKFMNLGKSVVAENYCCIDVPTFNKSTVKDTGLIARTSPKQKIHSIDIDLSKTFILNGKYWLTFKLQLVKSGGWDTHDVTLYPLGDTVMGGAMAAWAVKTPAGSYFTNGASVDIDYVMFDVHTIASDVFEYTYVSNAIFENESQEISWDFLINDEFGKGQDATNLADHFEVIIDGETFTATDTKFFTTDIPFGEHEYTIYGVNENGTHSQSYSGTFTNEKLPDYVKDAKPVITYSKTNKKLTWTISDATHDDLSQFVDYYVLTLNDTQHILTSQEYDMTVEEYGDYTASIHAVSLEGNDSIESDILEFSYAERVPTYFTIDGSSSTYEKREFIISSPKAFSKIMISDVTKMFYVVSDVYHAAGTNVSGVSEWHGDSTTNKPFSVAAGSTSITLPEGTKSVIFTLNAPNEQQPWVTDRFKVTIETDDILENPYIGYSTNVLADHMNPNSSVPDYLQTMSWGAFTFTDTSERIYI